MKVLRPAICLLLVATPALSQKVVVRSGADLVYDTNRGPVQLDNLTIEEGATIRIVGAKPFALFVTDMLQIDGVLDLSGVDARDVAFLNTGDLPHRGGAGSSSGGFGGTSSEVTSASTPKGGDGFGQYNLPGVGGLGGESGYASAALGKDARRPGGGGGGRFAADQPADPDPFSPLNAGLVARDGRPGDPQAAGALSGQSPPQGGAAGVGVFVDENPANDFWGLQLTPLGLVVGELAFPLPGRGGGAGGDAVPSTVFPQLNWNVGSDEKGGSGGGGGGLGLISARMVVFGPNGRVRVDGGRGGRGENTYFLDHIGASGGGGSGGFLVLNAMLVDLRLASGLAITALGGPGGDGHDDTNTGTSAGGQGGPGVIQLHTHGGGVGLLLPVGKSLGDLTSPTAHSLLPLFQVP